MPDVSGLATTFDLPQYVGELFQKNRRANTFVRLIGGIAGASIRLVGSKRFPMGVNYDVDVGAQTAVLEGADPSPTATDTAQEDNVLQIFQQSVKLSYSRQGQNAFISGIAIDPNGAGAALNQPGTIEWQLARHMEKIQNDVNYSIARGAYVNPGDNTTGRQTRGIRTAVTTHDTNAAAAALAKSHIDSHFRTMVENGAIEMGAVVNVTGTAAALEKLINLYESATQVPEARDVAGVAIRRIVTKFATLDLSWDGDVAANELVTWQPGVCQMVGMPIPDKGVLFPEMLAKTGAAEHWQIYGELGIDYTSEFYHGVIRNFT